MSFIRATVASVTFTPSGATAAADKIKARAKVAVENSCKFIYDESQNLVHVDSGDLKDSGEIIIDEYDSGITGHVVYHSDHAVYNEFGTGRRGAESEGAGPYAYNPNWPGMTAIPFLRPALDICRSQIEAEFKAIAI